MKRITIAGSILISLLLAACGGGQSRNVTGSGPLNADEEAGLVYMREEEELARDIYMMIFNNKGLVTFQTISQNSETKHADRMLSLLNTYGVVDPSTGQPDTYSDPALQALYNQLLLTATGAASTALSAYQVGALVEETDIKDINDRKLLVTANHPDLTTAYDNLLCGSRNHLRSFVSQIQALNGGQPYVAQVPSLAAEVASILASGQEMCGM